MGQISTTQDTADVTELARVIWQTSRSDESTISATGANHVARAVLDSGWARDGLKECDWEHGHEGNAARVYGHHGSPRTCIRLKATGRWVYDPAWEHVDQPPRMPVQPPPPPYQPYA